MGRTGIILTIIAVLCIAGKPIVGSLSQGLMLSLDLDEQGGKIAVDGTRRNTCTLSGTTINFANGACNFTVAGSDFIDCGNTSSVNPTTQLTISMWVKCAAGTASTVGKMSTSSTNYAYSLFLNTDNKVFWAQSNTGGAPPYCVTTATLTASVWHHCVGVFDGAGAGNSTKVFIYVDGINMALGFSGTIVSSIFQSTATLKLNSLNGSPYGTGAQRGAKMWHRVMSHSEVHQLYTREKNRFGR